MPIRSRFRAILVGLLMLMLLSVSVPGAQATEVEWRFSSEPHPADESRFLMEARADETVDTGAVPLPAVFVSNANTTVPLDMAGTWTVNLQFNIAGATGDVNVEVGVLRGGAFVPYGIESQTILSASVQYQVELDAGEIAEVGDYLAVRLTRGVGLGTFTVNTGTSNVQSPFLDPNFPVPELGSILLLAAGLGVVGSVVYVHKRKRA